MEIVLGWISKHLDKPGFDELVKLCDLGFSLLNLRFNQPKLGDNPLLSLQGRKRNLDFAVILEVNVWDGRTGKPLAESQRPHKIQ